MSERDWRPGRLLIWLAERIVPERIRDEFLGDLVEEARRRGPLGGRLRFLAQLALSTPALTVWRLRRSGRGRHGAVGVGLLGALLWFAWKRTTFRLLAAVTALGAVEMLAISGLLLAFPLEQVLTSHLFWIVAAMSMGLYIGVWFWSRRSDPVAWERWTAVGEETDVLGFLLLRHISIPDPADTNPAA